MTDRPRLDVQAARRQPPAVGGGGLGAVGYLLLGPGGLAVVIGWLATLLLAVVRVAGGRGGETCCALLGITPDWFTVLLVAAGLPLVLLARWVAMRRRRGR